MKVLPFVSTIIDMITIAFGIANAANLFVIVVDLRAGNGLTFLTIDVVFLSCFLLFYAISKGLDINSEKGNISCSDKSNQKIS